MKRVRLAAGVEFVLLLICLTPALSADPSDDDRRFNYVYQILEKMQGQLDSLRDGEASTRIEIIRLFASRDDLMSRLPTLVQDVYASGHANQQAAFYQSIKDELCRTDRELCVQRKWLENHEDRLRELEGTSGHAGVVVRGQSGDTTAPLRPVPVKEPVVIPVHGIVHYRGALCPIAVCIARCIEVNWIDGFRYHGDLHTDCTGRNILVTHVFTGPYPDKRRVHE